MRTDYKARCEHLEDLLLDRYAGEPNPAVPAFYYLSTSLALGLTYEQIIEACEIDAAGRRVMAATDIDRQPRERPVPCAVCLFDTWNLGRVCDCCLDAEAASAPIIRPRPMDPAAADELGAHHYEMDQAS